MPSVLTDQKTKIAVDYSFGNWIKRRRKALDMTQQELAQKVRCSVSLIFKMESDERRPSRQIAELLAEHLEIPSDQRAVFLKVARQEKSTDRLQSISPLPETRLDPAPTQLKPSPPVPLTSIIGREHELRAIVQQLQNPLCRLLTLTGPGGVGKTRLALEVAHQPNETFKNGVCFVSLVGTSAPEFIVPAIADALGFVFSGATELNTQLFNYLKEHQILLILDNLEHLLDGIELLDELLEYAPGIKLLTTSREPLNLRAEWKFEVQGLPVPAHIELNNLESNSAAALFVQRAKQANTNFAFSSESLPAITRICQLVDGLPLGLELAATWVRAMSLKEIAREIESSIDFLATTARDAPQRHRSIRAVFDYSWNLLSTEERRAIGRLSVFRSGFTREAAEKVARATVPLLSTLVDKSLVRHSETGRYDLHELLRQYVNTQLRAEAQEEQEVRRLHAEYYLLLLETHKSKLQSHQQRDALAMLIPETDNIRAAWGEALSNRRLDLIRHAAWTLWYMYELRTYFREGEALIKRGVDTTRKSLAQLGSKTSGPERTALLSALGTLLAHQAFFCFRLGRNLEAQELYQESIAVLRTLDEASTLAFALGQYGILRSLQGAYEDAVIKVREAIELSRAVEDRWQLALYTTFLGMTIDDQGDYPEAYRLFTESLQICRSLGDPRLISLAAGYLAQTAYTLGRLTELPDLLREELQAAAETNDRFGIALAGVRMALAAQSRGNAADAHRMLIESINHFREAGDAWFLSHSLNFEGQLALAAGNRVEAQESFTEAGRVAFATQAFPVLLDALLGLAILDAENDHVERALESVLHVLANPSSNQGTKKRAKRLQLELEAQLTLQQIQSVKLRAQSKTLDAIVQGLQII